MIQGGGVQHINGGYDWREWGNGSVGFATNTWYHIVYMKKNSIEYAYVNAYVLHHKCEVYHVRVCARAHVCV